MGTEPGSAAFPAPNGGTPLPAMVNRSGPALWATLRMTQELLTSREARGAPRSVGTVILSVKRRGDRSGLDQFRTSGASKVAFPRSPDAVEAILVNTSGGLTGGDRFEVSARAGPESRLVLTTQAAERAYLSRSGAARMRTSLVAERGAVLHWLPQELILFDGAFIERRLDLEVSGEAEAVLVEPVVFGRRAMGETRLCGVFRDRITISRDGVPVFRDRIDLSGAISDRLDRPAVAGRMSALASAVYAGPRAEALLRIVRPLLPPTAGASLAGPGLLVLRLLAEESFLLRRTLVPVLERLTGRALPKSWSL